MTTATHWSHTEDPEQWMDNPAESPTAAAEALIQDRDSDQADEIRDDLLRGGSPVQFTVYGYRETSEPLEEDRQFDGYEPGCTYFASTGETLKVKVSIAYEVLP